MSRGLFASAEIPCIALFLRDFFGLPGAASSAFTMGTSFGSPMSAEVLEQPVLGSRRLSNYLVAAAVSIGGIGFLLASLSSYLGRDLLPLGHPAALIFVPQGLVMGLYSIAAALLATYLWYVIAVDVGGGSNRFDKAAGVVTVSRRGFRKPVLVEIPLKDVKAVKVEVRDGFNARRRVALRIQGRRDMPLTRVGEPLPLAQLEQDGAELARFLGVNLEGL
ncbi:photosystem I assembly protein (Ycf4 family) [Parasynechococcus marenigrum WH 8102]|nr:photosystem I assembly protein (Ycf4 family) [Parasynechococcus marenigrum WH 8102]